MHVGSRHQQFNVVHIAAWYLHIYSQFHHIRLLLHAKLVSRKPCEPEACNDENTAVRLAVPCVRHDRHPAYSSCNVQSWTPSRSRSTRSSSRIIPAATILSEAVISPIEGEVMGGTGDASYTTSTEARKVRNVSKIKASVCPWPGQGSGICFATQGSVAAVKLRERNTGILGTVHTVMYANKTRTAP